MKYKMLESSGPDRTYGPQVMRVGEMKYKMLESSVPEWTYGTQVMRIGVSEI